MERDLEYYLKLPYIIEVVPIPESEGGGYIARLPEIGRLAITGDGETPEEAIDDLGSVKRDRFAEYLKNGIAIPEPDKEREDYSGRFLLRIPKILHRQLVVGAKENSTSLNQYATYLLASNFHLDRQNDQFETIRLELDGMREDIWTINYSYVGDPNGLYEGLDVDFEGEEEKATIYEFPKLKAA
jgi:predicted HicB family RNase H-like nuclease